MKCAVLCNGPSRVSYQSREGYDFVIGCNIPWTEVDATVVVDEEIIRLWAATPTLITVPTYFGDKAWRYTDSIRKRDVFQPYFAGLMKVDTSYPSSGHVAADVALQKGATEIDIYGCDSWFKESVDSYTEAYVPSGPNKEVRRAPRVRGWRERWNRMIEGNPTVQINFIP